MKLTKSQLKQIIKEELENALKEDILSEGAEGVGIIPLVGSVTRKQGKRVKAMELTINWLSSLISLTANPTAKAHAQELVRYLADQKAKQEKKDKEAYDAAQAQHRASLPVDPNDPQGLSRRRRWRPLTSLPGVVRK